MSNPVTNAADCSFKIRARVGLRAWKARNASEAAGGGRARRDQGEQLTPERAEECEMSFKRSRIGACEGPSLGQPDRCPGDNTGMELKM